MADKGLPWELRKRGLKDSIRHDQRVKDAIKKNLRELIAEEAIIASDGKKTVKIPLRYLDQYRFKYGSPQQGTGQGAGNPGDVLGRRSGDGNQSGDGLPGDQPGEHVYEAEIQLEELTQMMLEDLALPWLEEKPHREIISHKYVFSDIRKKGAWANFDKKRSLLANVKRHAAQGEPHVGKWSEDDPRFRTWNIEEEQHANAAVYMLMDCSGSMTTGKKYIAKSFFFWMVRFLRLKYDNVDCVFVAHDVEAEVVPEQDFFALSNSGGTRCSSAYEIAIPHIKAEHPTATWNDYLFHFSDGDNLPSDNAPCKAHVEELLDMGCVMVGYGEIRHADEDSFYNWSGYSSYTETSLLKTLKEVSSLRFLWQVIQNKAELYQTLQKFLTPNPAPAQHATAQLAAADFE
jgi:sporulation protein YhbH